MRCMLPQAVRRRPWTITVLLSLLLCAGAAAGLYTYAVHQFHAAQVAVKEGRAAEAREQLKICLLLWPRSVPVHLLAGRAARLSGDFDDAEAHLNRCLKLQKNNTGDTELEFLLMGIQQGRVDEVAPILWQCVNNHHPESCVILETMARAYMHNLRYGPALTCLDRWIEEAPNAAKAYDWRGWVLERLNQDAKAQQDYQRAVEIDPDLDAARLRLADLCLRLSNSEEALPHLERLYRQHPERADVRARLGQCRFLRGELEEAHRLLESAVQELPEDTPLLVTLGKLDTQEGRPERAETWLRRALKIDPTDAEAEYTLANCLRAQRRTEEADAMLEQYRKDSEMLRRIQKVLQQETTQPSRDPDALCEIGEFFLRGRQEHLAEYWLHQALECDPQHVRAHKALAEFYEKKGETAKAAEHRRYLRTAENGS